LRWARHDHRIACIVGDSAGFCEDFKDGDGPIRLVHHRVLYRADQVMGLLFLSFTLTLTCG